MTQYRSATEGLHRRCADLERELHHARREIRRLTLASEATSTQPEPETEPTDAIEAGASAPPLGRAYVTTALFAASAVALLVALAEDVAVVPAVVATVVTGVLSLAFGTIAVHRAGKRPFSWTMFESVFWVPFVLMAPGVGAFLALWRVIPLCRGRFAACSISVNDDRTDYEDLSIGTAGVPLGLWFLVVGLGHLALAALVCH